MYSLKHKAIILASSSKSRQTLLRNAKIDFLQSNKLPGFEEFDEVSYYYTPTPFTELMYRSVFEQGQILDAIFTVNTSEKLNFSISRKGLRSLGNYQNYISNSSNFKVTTNYISENDTFGFRAHYSSQKLYGEQNGGISELDINNNFSKPFEILSSDKGSQRIPFSHFSPRIKELSEMLEARTGQPLCIASQIA